MPTILLVRSPNPKSMSSCTPRQEMNWTKHYLRRLGSDTTVPRDAQSVLFIVPQKRPCYLDNYRMFFIFLKILVPLVLLCTPENYWDRGSKLTYSTSTKPIPYHRSTAVNPQDLNYISTSGSFFDLESSFQL
jgi:hypothetical protein